MRIDVDEACNLLFAGNVVAIPTETVYGLAASLKCDAAIDNVYRIKGRPSDNPLIVHLADASRLEEYVRKTPYLLEKLIDAFWPGPLTLVLPIVDASISKKVSAGLPTVAFRIPKNPLALEVIAKVGPLVMPSANLSGKPSGTSPEHIEMDFGLSFPVLDGGSCSYGLESTILIYNTNDYWSIIRQGAIPQEKLAETLGYLPEIIHPMKGIKPLCPGQQYRHYAPNAKLTLAKNAPQEIYDAIVGFDNRYYASQSKFFSLGNVNNPQEAAERLYAVLRELDTCDVKHAWVDIDFPENGLFATIIERLQRAACM